jgi:hypothetical protein
MNCPYCDDELQHIGYVGGNQDEDFYEHGYPDFLEPLPEVFIDYDGEILKCENDICIAYEQYFYTDRRGILHEGYPHDRSKL